jgi:GMP synthase (glutamine-hydrolysing)
MGFDSPLRLLVLQHIACEPPGAYADVLRERGALTETVALDAGDVLPDRRAFDGILAMGGPMSVNDESELPWLAAEKRYIAEAVRAGLPFFGACLGAQLLAASLGARVYTGPAPEVGVMSVNLTEAASADPVLGGSPPELLTFQWHSDTFDLPEGAVLLASSSNYPNQAFRWNRAYGLQFHLEVSPAMVRDWATVPVYAESLERVQGPGALAGLVEALAGQAESVLTHGRLAFGRWLDRVVVPARAGTRGNE